MACSSLLSDDDLRRFRTKPCRRNKQFEGNGSICEFGPDRCQYSHSYQWARRCPFYLSNQASIRYIPQVCPDVALGQDIRLVESRTIGTVISNKCHRGGSCPYAHSLEEVLYHPLWYKTKPCLYFSRGECNTYYCPFVHGTAETRDVRTTRYNLPFTKHLFKSSPLPNVELTEKLPTSQPKSSEPAQFPPSYDRQQKPAEQSSDTVNAFKKTPFSSPKNLEREDRHILQDQMSRTRYDVQNDNMVFQARSPVSGSAPPLLDFSAQFDIKPHQVIKDCTTCPNENAENFPEYDPSVIDSKSLPDPATWTALFNALGLKLLETAQRSLSPVSNSSFNPHSVQSNFRTLYPHYTDHTLRTRNFKMELAKGNDTEIYTGRIPQHEKFHQPNPEFFHASRRPAGTKTLNRISVEEILSFQSP